MNQAVILTDEEARVWTGLVHKGLVNAVSGLSQMVGQDMGTSDLNSKRVPINEVTNLVGGPESLSVGVYLGVSGSAEGHMVLVYQPDTARGHGHGASLYRR